MNYKIVKYSSLLFLSLWTLKMNIHFGDYCSGMPDGILWFFLCIVFVVAFLIFLGIDIYKKKFDYKILIIFMVTIFSNYNINSFSDYITNGKLKMKGVYEEGYHSNEILFFKDGTFKMKMTEIEWSCYYYGNYSIKNNLLMLEKANLIVDSDNTLTNKYLIDLKAKKLIPVDSTFKSIQLVSNNQNIE